MQNPIWLIQLGLKQRKFPRKDSSISLTHYKIQQITEELDHNIQI